MVAWLACFFLDSYLVTYYSYLILWVTFCGSLVGLVNARNELLSLIKFKIDKKDYNYSLLKFLSENSVGITGGLLVIFASFFHVSDVTIKSSDLYATITERLSEEKGETLQVGMVTVEKLHVHKSKVEFYLNLPIYNETNQQRTFYISNGESGWNIIEKKY
jgi:hypothetical protein